MAFNVKVGPRRTDAPAGNFQAVCVDFVDRGMQKNYFDKKNETLVHKVEICWELAVQNPWGGQPFFASKTYTLSLDERSNLHKDLSTWLGPLVPGDTWDETKFNALVGKNATLTLTPSPKGDFNNVTEVGPPAGAPTLQPSPTYRRQKWADANDAAENSLAVTTTTEITDNDIPF
jgi:hypothetical protein